jgi:alpha-D-ribose 1-methylphosphonate 5-triphosphate diphosphatase PhnM
LSSYDGQIAVSGITTVFDPLRVGDDADRGPLNGSCRTSFPPSRRRERTICCAATIGCTCVVRSAPTDVVDQAAALVDQYEVGLLSLMDYTPGPRQFVDLEVWKTYFGARCAGHGWEDHHSKYATPEHVAQSIAAIVAGKKGALPVHEAVQLRRRKPRLAIAP